MNNKIGSGLATPENILTEAREVLTKVDADFILLQERMAQAYLLEGLIPPNLKKNAHFTPAFDFFTDNELRGKKILILDEHFGSGKQATKLKKNLEARGAIVSVFGLYCRPAKYISKKESTCSFSTIAGILPEDLLRPISSYFRMRAYGRPDTLCVDHFDFIRTDITPKEFIQFLEVSKYYAMVLKIPNMLDDSNRYMLTLEYPRLKLNLPKSSKCKITPPDNLKIRIYYDPNSNLLRACPLGYSEISIPEEQLKEPLEFFHSLEISNKFLPLFSDKNKLERLEDKIIFAKRFYHLLYTNFAMQIGVYLSRILDESTKGKKKYFEIDRNGISRCFGQKFTEIANIVWEKIRSDSIEFNNTAKEDDYIEELDLLLQATKDPSNNLKKLIDVFLESKDPLNFSTLYSRFNGGSRLMFSRTLDLAIDLDKVRALTLVCQPDNGYITVKRVFRITETGTYPNIIISAEKAAILKFQTKMMLISDAFANRISREKVGLTDMNKSMCILKMLCKAEEIETATYHYGKMALLPGRGAGGKGMRIEEVAKASGVYKYYKQGDHEDSSVRLGLFSSVDWRNTCNNCLTNDEILLNRSAARVAVCLSVLKKKMRVWNGEIFDEDDENVGCFQTTGIILPEQDYKPLITLSSMSSEQDTYLCAWTNAKEWLDGMESSFFFNMKSRNIHKKFPKDLMAKLNFLEKDCEQIVQKLVRYYSLKATLQDLRNRLATKKLETILIEDDEYTMQSLINACDESPKKSKRLEHLEKAYISLKAYTEICKSLLKYPFEDATSATLNNTSAMIEKQIGDIRKVLGITTLNLIENLEEALLKRRADTLIPWMYNLYQDIDKILRTVLLYPEKFKDPMFNIQAISEYSIAIQMTRNRWKDIETLTVVAMDYTGFSKTQGDLGPDKVKKILARSNEVVENVRARYDSIINLYAMPEEGDSWLLYFRDPIEALTAAIHIQKVFEYKNEEFSGLNNYIKIGISQGFIEYSYGREGGNPIVEAVRLSKCPEAHPNGIILSERFKKSIEKSEIAIRFTRQFNEIDEVKDVRGKPVKLDWASIEFNILTGDIRGQMNLNKYGS